MIIATIDEFEIYHQGPTITVYRGDSIIYGDERTTMIKLYEKELKNSNNWLKFVQNAQNVKETLQKSTNIRKELATIGWTPDDLWDFGSILARTEELKQVSTESESDEEFLNYMRLNPYTVRPRPSLQDMDLNDIEKVYGTGTIQVGKEFTHAVIDEFANVDTSHWDLGSEEEVWIDPFIKIEDEFDEQMLLEHHGSVLQ